MNIDGRSHELSFWENFTKTRRFQNNWLSPTPNPELQPETRDIIEGEIKGKKKYRVLDLGCGAISILYGTVPVKNLTSADPLAHEYKKMVDYPDPALEPQMVSGENMPYKDDSFDVVHISNAIDHASKPLKVVAEMDRVCKPGGVVIISGFVDEGLHEQYKGLHQFNIHIISGIGGEKILECQDKAGGNVFAIDARYNGELILGDTVKLETGRDYFIYAYRKD